MFYQGCTISAISLAKVPASLARLQTVTVHEKKTPHILSTEKQ